MIYVIKVSVSIFQQSERKASNTQNQFDSKLTELLSLQHYNTSWVVWTVAAGGLLSIGPCPSLPPPIPPLYDIICGGKVCSTKVCSLSGNTAASECVRVK